MNDIVRCEKCDYPMEYVSGTDERWTGVQDIMEEYHYEGWECTNNDCGHFEPREDFEDTDMDDDS